MTAVIDAHVHVWDLVAHPRPWTESFPRLHRSFRVEDLRAVLNEHGVDAAIVVQAGDTTDETLELLAVADTEPVIAGVVGWADFTAPDLLAQVDRLRAAPGVLNCFGADRVMTGSDWPVCLLAADYATVQATLAGALARVDTGSRTALLGGTVHRWYLGEAA